jgi:hypothetical protein
MAADESRAARIRALKDQFPSTTWRHVAETVGVSERSVSAWASNGAMAYDNAKKLTAFFQSLGAEIADDYIWRGEHVSTPDLLGSLNGRTQLDRIETKLDAVLQALTQLDERVAEAELRQAGPDAEALAQSEAATRATAPPRPRRQR